jgi:hypothetical protein
LSLSQAISRRFRCLPTFQSQLFVPMDSNFTPMAAVRSCRFLELGESVPGRFYARCALGTARERRAWLSELDPEKLASLRHFRQRLSLAVGKSADQLWVLKSDQLKAHRAANSELERDLTRRLAAAAVQVEAVIGAFLMAKQETMRELGMPMTQTQELIHVLVEFMVLNQHGASGPVPIPPEILKPFPPELRRMFLPYEEGAAGPKSE